MYISNACTVSPTRQMPRHETEENVIYTQQFISVCKCNKGNVTNTSLFKCTIIMNIIYIFLYIRIYITLMLNIHY